MKARKKWKQQLPFIKYRFRACVAYFFVLFRQKKIHKHKLPCKEISSKDTKPYIRFQDSQKLEQ